jgi:hypothetical protein
MKRTERATERDCAPAANTLVLAPNTKGNINWQIPHLAERNMAEIKFKGKTFVQNHHLLVPYHELIPVKSKSLTDKVSLHDNLIIHGDNLKALKALLPMYAGKIKCIYIDPPYNTGNENWVYNDNVNSPMM